jgi:hypothetical protein
MGMDGLPGASGMPGRDGERVRFVIICRSYFTFRILIIIINRVKQVIPQA